MKKSLVPVTHKVNAEVTLPGSKSMCNRALLIAAMAKGTTTLNNMLFSDDVEACIEALKILGVGLEVDQQNRQVIVYGCNGVFPNKEVKIFTREAGTLTRFLIPLCAAQKSGGFYFSASERMMERPLAELMEVLESQGCEIDYHGKAGYMPFTLKPKGLKGGEETVCGKKSSQFFSGLLLASIFAEEDFVLISETDHRQPYVEMTAAMMKVFGVGVEVIETGYQIKSGLHYQGHVYTVEPDVSTASYFWALAAITNGSVCVKHTTLVSEQGDIRFLEVLEAMGCCIRYEAEGIRVIGAACLKGVTVNMRNFSDTFMTVAVVACFAEGVTLIEGLSHTRLQESDRVSAMVDGLKRFGVKVEESEDSLKVFPIERMQGAEVLAYNDHRIAMSLSLMGLKVPGVVIDGAECVKKTCPDYFERMSDILYV
ncbi:3-phosphoshikimate 1-carboxyvinyltransferase [Francisellaceae bacterium]|nr:3-phosphoshikimate 1-carboxyvinyltransferase [Francisellaceae bacterium]